MEALHLIHSAVVQENDYTLKLEGSIRMMPYFFALNKTNYSRYGSYYIQQLISLDRTHPGCKELIEIKGVSVQAQDQYPLRTAIDQRGQQTLNREAKSVDGIGRFGGNIDSIIKWTLNRASQAKITAELKLFAQVNKSEEMYKAFRPHQIRKSENWTATLAQVISQDFLNPFDCNLDSTKLYNLSSGVPVDETSCLGILSIKGHGEKRYHDFVDSRLLSEEAKCKISWSSHKKQIYLVQELQPKGEHAREKWEIKSSWN